MSTWIVDEARGLSELETRLNALESDGFSPIDVLLVGLLRSQFVILAVRREKEGAEREGLERQKRPGR